MIERYSLPEMKKIWTDENRFQQMLQVEIYACEAMCNMGLIPKEAFEDIRTKASFNVQRIAEIEEVTKHDVIAFLTAVAENVGDASKYIHMGMTSSDVLDTALSVQMKQSAEILLGKLHAVRDILAAKAKEYKYTLEIGRTHGIHAEPVTFGLKMALWTMEIDRETDMDVTPAELRVSELVREYWRLPASISPPACNNLYQTLLNSGYMTIVRQNGLNIDKAKLYTALCDYHGAETVAKRFGASITTSMMNRIKTWEQLLPDRYILIQAMLDLPTKAVFGPEPIRDKLREKIERMAKQGGFCTLQQVAGELHLKQYEVNAILRYYDMDPFWREVPAGKSQTARKGVLRCTVDEAELERIRQSSHELGYHCAGAFALDCMRYVMEKAELSRR